VPASSNTSAFTPPPPLSAGSGGRSGGGGGGISPNSATYPHHQHQHSGQGNLSGVGTAGTAGGQPNQNPNLDYEQAGIDFVLT
jgi:hypothetical protein